MIELETQMAKYTKEKRKTTGVMFAISAMEFQPPWRNYQSKYDCIVEGKILTYQKLTSRHSKEFNEPIFISKI